MIVGLWIPSRITHPVQVIGLEKLEDYQAAVGGNIEAVDLPLLNTSMFVNEEGRLRGLEFNPRATALWWYWVPSARTRATLHGDALLVGWPDSKGDSTDLDQDLIDIMTAGLSFRIEVQRFAGDDWHPLDSQMPYIDYFDALLWALIEFERSHPHELKVVTTVPRFTREDPARS